MGKDCKPRRFKSCRKGPCMGSNKKASGCHTDSDDRPMVQAEKIWAVLRSPAKSLTFSGLNGNPHKTLRSKKAKGMAGSHQEAVGNQWHLQENVTGTPIWPTCHRNHCQRERPASCEQTVTPAPVISSPSRPLPQKST